MERPRARDAPRIPSVGIDINATATLIGSGSMEARAAIACH
jgi:hypothetical protein